jgi:4-hydroxythreonine-4-phosphate dehydrogenase
MIFIYKNKFFIPLTIHIEIKKVHNFFKKKENVITKILSINKTLQQDFKIKNPKIIVSGINPHAGENGIISKDDQKYLNPVINFLKTKKLNITGPVSGDGMINSNNLIKYDAFLFTYHDQALIPFKLISNYGGVNFTSNLDIIRTSPSHGTAENLVNKKIANSKGILNSFNQIKKIYKNRFEN